MHKMYKIQPFNSSKVAINIQSNCRERRLNFKLLFVNKALDMINLPLIFRNKELKSFVNFCNIPEPSVQYQYRSGIGSKLFNYNQTSNLTTYKAARYIYIYKFFPKPKRFGCFVAAVLLILSPKELI